jgi:hypothetical protein
MKLGQASRLLSPLVITLAGSIVIGGCCGNENFDTVLVNVDSPGVVGDHGVSMWVGDRVPVIASAWQSPNDFCGGDSVFYTSQTKPSAFTYMSSDTTVATIGASGTLTILAIGRTVITVTSAAIAGTMHVVTGVPVASVGITVSPSSPRAGDTITFHAVAFDAAGVPLDSSWVQLSLSVGPLLPFTSATQRTIGGSGQRITAFAKAVHDGAPASTAVTANIVVTVAPAPP